MNLLLSDIAQIVKGELHGNNLSITGVCIDTRTLSSGQLYIALKGKNFDGHSFVDKADHAGATAVMLEQISETHLPQIIVKDCKLALAELAGYWRNQRTAKVVGVTGSNGKTTVKEMTAAILATRGKTLFTQGNLNNDIGVPLTLLRLDNSHDFAVIEMGANHPGEIAYSSAYARADISVITNIGAAHIEGFGDINGVARSKAEIYHNLSDKGIAVINRDDAFYPYFLEIVGRRQSVSFGLHQDADVRAENIETSLNEQGFQTRFEINTASAKLPIKLNLAGEHNVKNALAAAALAMQLDISLDEIKQGLEAVKPVTGRMQHLRGSKGNIVIDDTYNANPSSLKVALAALNSHDKNWLILGAFGELGADSPLIHKEMGELIKSMPIDRLFATGSFAEQTVKAFGQGAEYFENQEQLIDAVNKAITGKETLLVKGSRAQKMENVVAAMVDNFRAA